MALAKKAARAEKGGEDAQAYIYYSEASALQPRNRKYKGKLAVLQSRAARQSKPQPRPAEASGDTTQASDPKSVPPAELVPESYFDSMTEREMSQARELKSIPSLQSVASKAGKQNFDLTEDARGLFDKVATRFGLQTVFDGDYPTTGARVVFRIEGADYREALNELEAATGSFVVPLSARVFMVARDSQQKRNELEQTMAVAVPVPQAVTAQELTELAQVVRQTANVEKIAWDTSQGRIVIRDRVSRVLPAVALLQQLLSYRAEVMIDLEFIQVASSDLKNYGFNVTNSFSAVYLGQILNNVISSPTGAANLLTFGGGRTLIGIGVAQAQAMFNETYSTAKSLYQAQLRSVVGQPATLHVGEKFPVITGGYFGSVPASQAGQPSYAPPPSFTFEDLGLTLKVTPFVHGMGEVTLSLDTGFEVLTGQSINNIPVIGRRNLVSQVRLRNDEWAIVGGLMSTTNSKGVNGFWGLANLPLLGYLFRQTTTDKEDNNVIIGMRPHLLSLPPDQIVTKRLRVGSEIRPYTPL
ncbi:MAG: ral secretion pathway protein [Bryobacterales bacterium]|nr:ral secretion pathway protein [Bryobacterales bacterium]